MTLKSRFFAPAIGLRSALADIMPPSPFAFIAAVLAFLMVGGVCAFAQDAGAPSLAATFTSTLTKISNGVEALAIIIGAVFALVSGGRIIVQLSGLLGIKDATQKAQLEKLLNDRLHNAIGNAIQFAVTKSGLPISAVTLTTVLSDAVAYLQDKNPDTISFFNLEAKQLEDLIAANWPTVFGWLKGSEGVTISVPSADAVSGVAEIAAIAKDGVAKALQEFDAALVTSAQAVGAMSKPLKT